MPTLTVPGELASLDAIGEFVLGQARAAGLDNQATYQLRLAADELATNSIIHGYQEHNLSGDVTIAAEVNQDSLTIVIEDTAAPYDPLQADLERVEENFDKPLAERPIGGLGIFFVRQAVHEFRYEWREGRNRNTLVVHRPTAFAGAANSAHRGVSDL
jgi:anti-sigma regulatory factor (Ser/Thr protein kinase)